jgi:O-antigen/teichoic acid export membrane protein
VVKNRLLQYNAPPQPALALLKAVAPYAFIILAMSLHCRLDGFLLERLHRNGAYEAGVYAASFRLLDVANMVGYLVASFLVPFLARHRHDTSLVQQTVLTARHGLLLFGFFITLFLVMFAGPVQQALHPVSTPYAARVLQWCLPVLPAYLLLQVYGSLLTAMAQLKAFLRMLLMPVILNTVLNVLLIPRWGAMGCCVAALASQYLCAGCVYAVAVRKNKIAHEGKSWLQLALATLLLAGILYVGWMRSVHLVWLLVSGAAVALLALFAYLPIFKRLSLSR